VFIEPAHDEIVLLDGSTMTFHPDRISKPKHTILCIELIRIDPLQVLLGCEDGIVYFVGTKGCEQVNKHAEPVICISHMNGMIASASADGAIKVHDLQTKKSVEYKLETGVSKVKLFEGKVIACCWNGAVVSIDLDDNSIEKHIEHRKGLRSLAVGKTDVRILTNSIFCGSDDARISSWSL
jgi:WD40 repeat protein